MYAGSNSPRCSGADAVMTDFALAKETLQQPTCVVANAAWRHHERVQGTRVLPEESAIALTYDHSCHAVMMATPLDLEDFAVGFSLSEGIISSVGEVEDFEILETELGIELRMSIAQTQREALVRRRRRLAGPTGCGLCGVESLEAAMQPPVRVSSGMTISARSIAAAVAALPSHQSLHQATRAVHAAAFWQAGEGLVMLREDVGRHNALDKLVGALARARQNTAQGIVVLTSRVSIELVQKAAAMGIAVLVAVSAPTALAVRACAAAGITLVAVARGDGFEVFTHQHRIHL
jgi:FdhD protein